MGKCGTDKQLYWEQPKEMALKMFLDLFVYSLAIEKNIKGKIDTDLGGERGPAFGSLQRSCWNPPEGETPPHCSQYVSSKRKGLSLLNA